MIEGLRAITAWRHTRFEQLCALAPLGGLDAQQMDELELHLRGCSRCRESLEAAAQTALQIAPAFWSESKAMPSSPLPEGIRARFHRRLREDEADSEAEPPAPLYAFSERRIPLHRQAVSENPDGRRLGRIVFARYALAAAAMVALILAGYQAGRRSHPPVPSQAQASAAGNRDPVTAETEQAHDADRQRETMLASDLANLQAERTSAREEQNRLKTQLAEANAKLGSLEQTAALQLQESRHDTQAATQELQALHQDNEVLQSKLAQAESFQATLDHRIAELQTQLDLARTAARDEEAEHLPEGSLGQMMTARNLHIVDVYDADGGGTRKKSFGRVFYVEGKSLLFYAYDLHPAGQAKANVVFHVWGAGSKEVTHSLGLLRNDNSTEGLWTLSFDDPAVLAQINSVFVTAESADRRDSVPHGRKVLYAYFGNPANHP